MASVTISRIRNAACRIISSIPFPIIVIAGATVYCLGIALHGLMFFSVLGLTVFAITLIYYCAIDLSFLCRYFRLFFASIANLAGVVCCEFFSIKLSELGGIQTHFVGSIPALSFAWWIVFLIFWYESCQSHKNFSLKEKSNTREESEIQYICTNKKISPQAHDEVSSPQQKNCDSTVITWYRHLDAIVGSVLFPIAYLVVFSAVFLQVIDHPAFLLNVDRFTYAKMYPLGIFSKLMLYVYYSLPVLVTQIFQNRHRMLCISAIVVSILTYLWLGNKFLVFLNLLVSICFAICIWWEKNKNISMMKRYASRIFIVFLLLVACAVFIQMALGSNSTSGEYFFKRTAEQGQIWWKVYGLQEDSMPHSNEFGRELDVWFSPTDESEQEKDYGIYKMMLVTTPKEIVSAKLAAGSTYTEAGFACSYYYGGYVGLIIFSILMGSLLAILTRVLIRRLSDNRAIEAFLIFRLYTIAITAIGMFTSFHELFSPISLLSAVFLFVLDKIFKHVYTKEKYGRVDSSR
ncbi:MAG: DUF6418 domain-containing protein [Coriobacteriales bacterium]